MFDLLKYFFSIIFRNRRSHTVARIAGSKNVPLRSLQLCDSCDSEYWWTKNISFGEMFFMVQYSGVAGIAQSQGSQRHIIDSEILKYFFSINF